MRAAEKCGKIYSEEIYMQKIVLITGATSGYGLAAPKSSKRKRIRGLIASRNAEKVEKVVKENGFDKGYALDVTDYSGWEKVRKEVVSDYGRVDVLVKNTGGGVKIAPVTDQTKENIDEAICST